MWVLELGICDNEPVLFQARKIISLFLFLGILLASGFVIWTWKSGSFNDDGGLRRPNGFSYEIWKISIGGTMVKAKVADTLAKITKGLGGVKALKEGEGMIFLSSAPESSGFWMKDMFINIDIIWIGRNLTVVDIKKDASPDSFPEVFYPRVPALYVLEVPAGFSEKFGVKTGSEVVFSPN